MKLDEKQASGDFLDEIMYICAKYNTQKLLGVGEILAILQQIQFVIYERMLRDKKMPPSDGG